MLLRAIVGLCLTVALTAALACDPCQTEADDPSADVDGVVLYEYSTENPSDTVKIHLLGGGELQLAAATRVRATLTPTALELLNTTTDQVAAGTELGAFDPQCLGFLDSPRARLWLPIRHGSLNFGYLWGCPPSALVPLDLMLRDLVLHLPKCDPSPSFQNCRVGE